MGYPDLQAARWHQAALKHLIHRHAGDVADLRALRRAVDLCRAANEALDDAYCREKLRLAGEYAAELLGHGEHAKWDHGSLPGAEFLKRQILNALELAQSRVYSLELMRRGEERRASGDEVLVPPQ